MTPAFIWTDHLAKVITTALLSMVPAFEGRYAISVGMSMGMPMQFTFLLALIFSTLPMPLIMWLLDPILAWLYRLPIKPVRQFAAWVNRRAEKGADKVSKKGLLGLFLFVAIPLPGTGVWTGTAISVVLKMRRGPAALAIFLGNFVACMIMLLGTYGVLSLF